PSKYHGTPLKRPTSHERNTSPDSRWTGGKNNPEANDAILDHRKTVDTVRGAAGPRGVVPNPPAQHMIGPSLWALGIDNAPTWQSFRIPVLTPLPDVPMHIKQAP